jgi:hypothetical protein
MKPKKWEVGDEGYFFNCSGFPSLCNKRFVVRNLPDEGYQLYGVDFLTETGNVFYPMAATESELHRKPIITPKFPVGVLTDVKGVVRDEIQGS